MSDISPEDRERLIKVKYGELWDDALETRLQNPQFVDKLRKLFAEEVGEGQVRQEHTPRQQITHPDRRKNLLEVALGL